MSIVTFFQFLIILKTGVAINCVTSSKNAIEFDRLREPIMHKLKPAYLKIPIVEDSTSSACQIIFTLDYHRDLFSVTFSSLHNEQKDQNGSLTVQLLVFPEGFPFFDLAVKMNIIYTYTNTDLCNKDLFDYVIDTKPFELFCYEIYHFSRLLLIFKQRPMSNPSGLFQCFVDEQNKLHNCSERVCFAGITLNLQHQQCGIPCENNSNVVQVQVVTKIFPSQKRFDTISFSCEFDECNSIAAINTIKNAIHDEYDVSHLKWPTKVFREPISPTTQTITSIINPTKQFTQVSPETIW